MAHTFPAQRWHFYPAQPQRAIALAQQLDLPSLVAQVLLNRQVVTPAAAQAFLKPETESLTAPIDEFTDLAASVELLQTAIEQQQKIAICGDYDADGMTSTALLIRAIRFLGGVVDYAIPSRMHDGYGINTRIVETFAAEGVALVLTVDNGIAAYEPIAHARELGLTVIVTDHHDLPPQLPPANALLNPKLLPPDSAYRGLAGVGVAYILAVSLAQACGQLQNFVQPLLELFTLGTIADLAPLTGVNRRWVKRGLACLPYSQLAGIQALIEGAGLKPEPTQGEIIPASHPQPNSRPQKTLKPDDIGFRLGPRINAIGRIGDPQVVIELLTTDDPELARSHAETCEQTNLERRQLCSDIEQAAIAWCEANQPDLQQLRVLVIVQPDWHHGVIGIVASRLVERYGVPVFIGTFESDREIRGSARGIPEFNVFEALEYCKEVLSKHGGHKAAGGFSLTAENLVAFRQRLQEFACQTLALEHLKPLVTVDAEAQLIELDLDLYNAIDNLHPWGIDNPEPVFCSRGVQILEQRRIGQAQEHLKLTVSAAPTATATANSDPTKPTKSRDITFKAIAWRWGEFYPLPSPLDLVYKLRQNTWKGHTTLEFELLGIQLPQTAANSDVNNFATPQPTPELVAAAPAISPATSRLPRLASATSSARPVSFEHGDRLYTCAIAQHEAGPELRIRNANGQVLALQLGQTTGLLGQTRETAEPIDLQTPFFQTLIQQAELALQRKSRH
ncbi:MAG: DHH family phosphoesterase [Cyanobacteria bacterium P01_H01_bin.121]